MDVSAIVPVHFILCVRSFYCGFQLAPPQIRPFGPVLSGRSRAKRTALPTCVLPVIRRDNRFCRRNFPWFGAKERRALRPRRRLIGQFPQRNLTDKSTP